MALLQVVVAGSCFGCEEALRIFHEVRTRLPGLLVELVDLEKTPDQKPEPVFAVPAYLINGGLAFTGNPTLDQLLTRLRAAGVEDQGRSREQQPA